MESFARFRRVFSPDPGASGPVADLDKADVLRVLGMQPREYDHFMTSVARSSFNRGVLRFFLPPRLEFWNRERVWAEDWPKWRARLAPFAYDWLGRLFCFDRERVSDGDPMVAMLEPGTGQLLEIPVPFLGFIESELGDYSDAALAVDFHRRWMLSGGRPLATGECAGYARPLFLGGSDSVDNLEVCDLEVYLAFCGQAFAQVADAKTGTRIDRFERE